MMKLIFRKYSKGQSAIEFMIIFGAMFVFFISFILVLQGNLSDRAYEAKNLAVSEVAFTVQDEIALAHGSTDGYYREFDIPVKILNLDYEINLTSRSVYIITEDSRHSIALTVLNVTGSIQKGDNVIRKENGRVYLNSEVG